MVRKIYFLPFGSGLLLNIAKLRFVHMKGVYFYVLSALLGVLLSNSNFVVRKIYFLSFDSGLLLNIARLRFVHRKVCIFTCCLLCLAFLLSYSNIVIRKKIYS